jgi:hypothetical protein
LKSKVLTTLVSFIAGASLAGGGVAIAASTGVWEGAGASYHCMGDYSGAFCDSKITPYNFLINSKIIAIYNGKHVIFGCHEYGGAIPSRDCSSFIR